MKLPKNIERQCWLCHTPFRTAEGSRHILCHEHTQKWNRFKYITFPTYRNKWLGIDFMDDLFSFIHLNILNKEQLWLDADDKECPRRWCRYCGKGRK